MLIVAYVDFLRVLELIVGYIWVCRLFLVGRVVGVFEVVEGEVGLLFSMFNDYFCVLSFVLSLVLG